MSITGEALTPLRKQNERPSAETTAQLRAKFKQRTSQRCGAAPDTQSIVYSLWHISYGILVMAY